MKFASICILAGLNLAGLGCGYAADAPQPAMKEYQESPRHEMKDPAVVVQKHLDMLAQKLNLQPSQQDAWQTFSASMIKRAQEFAQARQTRRCGHDSHAKQDVSTPERLEKLAARMRVRADRLAGLASDTRTFYDQLSQDQKTIFDLVTKKLMHRHRDNGDRHWNPEMTR
jgi:periplasmic protein CpxP/Spy